MSRILIVEDDEVLLRGLVATLQDAGYAVDYATDGEGALELAQSEPFAVIILDVGLPDISGFDVLKRLRFGKSKIPVLMLTARDATEDRVTGLDLGADDYLLKPFEPSELEARIRALIRRSNDEPSPLIQIGDLVVDQSRCVATIKGRPIDLRRREWSVLERLVLRAGQVISKDRLTSEIFGFDEPVAPNAVEVYIGRLRRKLEPDGPRIRTLRGLGYVIDPN